MFEKCVKVIAVVVLNWKRKWFLIMLMIFLRGYFHFFSRFHSIYPEFVIKRHILYFSATQKIYLSKMGYMVFWIMGRKVEFLKRVQMFNSFLKRGGGTLPSFKKSGQKCWIWPNIWDWATFNGSHTKCSRNGTNFIFL